MDSIKDADLAKRILARQIVIEAARLNVDTKALAHQFSNLSWQEHRKRMDMAEFIAQKCGFVIVFPFMMYFALLLFFCTIGCMTAAATLPHAIEYINMLNICIPVKILEFPMVKWFGAAENYLFSSQICSLVNFNVSVQSVK